jgi:hypothetical protein
VSGVDLDALTRFLVDAKARTYAADDDALLRTLADGSSEVSFAEGDWLYRDRWYGGTRFAGQELVWRAQRALWSLSFHGAMTASASSDFPHFHKRALRRMPLRAPFRGPALYREAERVYVNDWSGTLETFQGLERVFEGEQEVFRLQYHGGTLAG